MAKGRWLLVVLLCVGWFTLASPGATIYTEDYETSPNWSWVTMPVNSSGTPGGVLQTSSYLLMYYPDGFASIGSAKDNRGPFTVSVPGNIVTISVDHSNYYQEPSRAKTLSYTVLYTDNTQEVITHNYSSIANDTSWRTFTDAKTLTKSVKQISNVTVSINRGTPSPSITYNYFFWDNLKICVSSPREGQDKLLDSFQYASSQEATAAWVPSSSPSSQNPQPATQDGVNCLNLPCAFTSQTTRAYWDKTVSLDLSKYDRFYFRLKVPNPSNVWFISVYFLTGSGGWWASYDGMPVSTSSWQTVVLPKSSFGAEGTCNGWMDIQKIRISIWQAQPQTTSVYFANFWAKADDLVIDSFEYVNNSAALAAWTPHSEYGATAQNPTVGTIDGTYCLTMPCSFGTPTGSNPRAFWDKTMLLNLEDYDRFSFRTKITDSSNIQMLSMYFGNGAGSYWCKLLAVPMFSNEWQNVVIDKSTFDPPPGSSWNDITWFRVSAWEAVPGTSNISFSDFRMKRDYCVIDSGEYALSSDARNVWIPGWNAQYAESAVVDGYDCVKLPYSFATSSSCAYWDKALTHDLSKCEKISFLVKLPNTANINSIDIILNTGGGGYYIKSNAIPLSSNNWQTVPIPLADFTEVGNCSGWDDIVNFEFLIRASATGPGVAYLRNVRAVMSPKNMLNNSSFETCSTSTLPDWWGTGDYGLINWLSTADGDTWRSRFCIDSTVAHSGSKSMKFIYGGDMTELPMISHAVRVKAGQTYTLSAWMKSTVYYCPVQLVATNEPGVQFYLTQDWQRCSLSFTKSSDQDIYAAIYPGGTASGTVWVDDMKLEEGNSVTGYRAADADVMLNANLAIHRTIPQVADYTITPGPTSITVSIDGNRRFIVDGQPFIPIAASWPSIPSATVINHFALAGFNTICIFAPANATVTEIQTALTAARTNGLKTIIWMDWNATQTTVQNWVVGLRNDPTLLAWYVYDEPQTITSEIQARYDLVKQLDPNRPAFLNYYTYTQSNMLGEIACIDRYPVAWDSIKRVGVDVKRMDGLAAPSNKPSWFWLQSHGYAYFSQREPTGPELECMTYDSLVNGARGFMYFIRQPHIRELADEIRLQTRELRTLTPIVYSIETPTPTVSVSPSAIKWMAKRYGGQTYVIAVNTSPSTVTGTITVPSGSTAEVLFESRQVSIVSSQIVDSFAPLQRHVYHVLP